MAVLVPATFAGSSTRCAATLPPAAGLFQNSTWLGRTLRATSTAWLWGGRQILVGLEVVPLQRGFCHGANLRWRSSRDGKRKRSASQRPGDWFERGDSRCCLGHSTHDGARGLGCLRVPHHPGRIHPGRQRIHNRRRKAADRRTCNGWHRGLYDSPDDSGAHRLVHLSAGRGGHGPRVHAGISDRGD